MITLFAKCPFCGRFLRDRVGNPMGLQSVDGYQTWPCEPTNGKPRGLYVLCDSRIHLVNHEYIGYFVWVTETGTVICSTRPKFAFESAKTTKDKSLAYVEQPLDQQTEEQEFS